jgi:hypothetical protein
VLALTLLLAGRSSNVIGTLLLSDGLALGELLGAALVGLAYIGGGKGTLLLSLLGKVLSIGHGLVFRLGLCGGLGRGFLGRSLDSGCVFLLVLLGNGLASLLVSPLGVTIGGTPALSSLLVGIAGIR